MADETTTGEATGEATEEPLTCITCGSPLGYSLDDQPYWPTGPMCGECYQARQLDDEIWWSELDETSEGT